MSGVGVLALQGGFEPHLEAFGALGVEACEVRTKQALEGLTHLVLPGGESTTLAHLMDLFDLRETLVQNVRSGRLAVFGTCAGAILLGRESGEAPRRLGLMDAEVHRNAYGTQTASRSTDLELDAFGRILRAVFIRAPRFGELGAEVRVLARDRGEPVLIEGPNTMAATFHPELSGDPVLHRYSLDASPARALLAAEERTA